MFHGPTRTLHADGAFTPEQLAELKADAQWLVVEEGVAPPPEQVVTGDPADKKPGGGEGAPVGTGAGGDQQ